MPPPSSHVNRFVGRNASGRDEHIRSKYITPNQLKKLDEHLSSQQERQLKQINQRVQNLLNYNMFWNYRCRKLICLMERIIDTYPPTCNGNIMKLDCLMGNKLAFMWGNHAFTHILQQYHGDDCYTVDHIYVTVLKEGLCNIQKAQQIYHRRGTGKLLLRILFRVLAIFFMR